MQCALFFVFCVISLRLFARCSCGKLPLDLLAVLPLALRAHVFPYECQRRQAAQRDESPGKRLGRSMFARKLQRSPAGKRRLPRIHSSPLAEARKAGHGLIDDK
ncbi:hypothetical protein BDR26DRAFT_877368, partial [Obelidium mucronatum]